MKKTKRIATINTTTAAMSTNIPLLQLFESKPLPQEVLHSILEYLTIISPSLVLRLSSHTYNKNAPALYETLEITGDTVYSILQGAMKPPLPHHGQQFSAYRCGVHPHEVNIDWYSRKVQALSHVDTLIFRDKEGIKQFSRILGESNGHRHSSDGPRPKRWRKLFPSSDYLILNADCVKALSIAYARKQLRDRDSRDKKIIKNDLTSEDTQILEFIPRLNPHILPSFICLGHRYPLSDLEEGDPSFDLDIVKKGTKTIHTYFGRNKSLVSIRGTLRVINLMEPSDPGSGSIGGDEAGMLETEVDQLVRMFKTSTCDMLARAKQDKSYGPIKLEYCVPSPYAYTLIEMVDEKMKGVIGNWKTSYGYHITQYDDYLRTWKDYIDIVDVEDSEVCACCGKQ